MKSGKRETMERIEVPNQENITLEEKKDYKKRRLLEADTIRWRWKKKRENSASEEQENFSKPTLRVKISSYEKTP